MVTWICSSCAGSTPSSSTATSLVLLNRQGIFQKAAYLPSLDRPVNAPGVAIADLDGDGRPEIYLPGLAFFALTDMGQSPKGRLVEGHTACARLGCKPQEPSGKKEWSPGRGGALPWSLRRRRIQKAPPHTGAPGGGDAWFLGLAPQATCRRPSGTLGGCRAFRIPSPSSRARVLLAGFPPAFCSPGTGRRRVAWGENPRNRPEKRHGAPAGAVPFPGRCVVGLSTCHHSLLKTSTGFDRAARRAGR